MTSTEQSASGDLVSRSVATAVARERDEYHRLLIRSEREADAYRVALRRVLTTAWGAKVKNIARDGLEAGERCRS